MIAQLLSRKLRSALAAQGRLTARHPLPFLLVPLVMTASLGYGFVHLSELMDGQNALELYIPRQGLSDVGKKRITQRLGATYQAELDPVNGVSFSLLLTMRNGGDVLNADFVTDYLWLRRTLEALTVRVREGVWYSYAQRCYKDFYQFGDQCLPDLFTQTTARGVSGFRDVRLMKYPDSPLAPGAPLTRLPLGGVNTSRQGFVETARAALMTFHFPFDALDNGSGGGGGSVAAQWEAKMKSVVAQWRSARVDVVWLSMRQFQRDLDSIAARLNRLIPSLLAVILVFCVCACCVADWVHSKPLLAVAGVVSALLSIVSGFGLALLVRVPIVDIVFVAPFLILSIGVDDMFLMLAAWRKTSCAASTEVRMARTLADAAVSISITSLTDVLSFAIGAASVFPAVRYFCIYTAAALAFTYLYQISFFAAAMAYSGRREGANRHCLLLCWRMRTSDEEGDSRSLLYRVFCTGGDGKPSTSGKPGVGTISPPVGADDALSTLSDPSWGRAHAPNYAASGVTTNCGAAGGGGMYISPKDNLLNRFFQKYYAPLLGKRPVQVLAGLSYLLYMGMSVWGATTIRIGMNYAELLPDDAASGRFLVQFGHHFAATASPPLEVMLVDVDLSRYTAQTRTLEFMRRFEYATFTEGADFWLLPFLRFFDAQRTIRPRVDFYVALHEFLQDDTHRRYRQHVRYDPLRRVTTSRLLVQTRDITYGRERSFLNFVKAQLATAVTAELNATAFHSTFQLGEQQAAVLPAMLQTIGAATLAMLVISFLLIPKPACSLCLAACIVSTNLGVLGAMSLWGVRLDIISMITLLMSIGISVDFVAHVSHFYVQALELNIPVAKAQRALHYLGLPILQGAASTVCGMLVLLAIRAYMVRAFVKTLFLVIAFGLYHGLLLLPIVLSLFVGERQRQSKHVQVLTATAPAFRPISGNLAVVDCLPNTASTSLSDQGSGSYAPAEIGVAPDRVLAREDTRATLAREEDIKEPTDNWAAKTNEHGTGPTQDETTGEPGNGVGRSRKVLQWLMQNHPPTNGPAYPPVRVYASAGSIRPVVHVGTF